MIASLLLGAVPAQAGIYSSIDTIAENQSYGKTLPEFLAFLGKWKQVAAPEAISNLEVRRRYLLIEKLGEKQDIERLSIEDALDYSAVLIRRNRPGEAISVLLPLTTKHPENFLIVSQCALATFLASGDDLLVRAVELQQQALEAWPERYDALDENQKKLLTRYGFDDPATFDRLRRYETHLHRLMKHRWSEARKLKKKQKLEETVDHIFGDPSDPVTFLAEGGKFEVGRIKDSEYRKLPNDKVDVVKQLLLWMPMDLRLVWLLAEVYNASAMDYSKQDDKNDAIRDAFVLFEQLETESFGRTQMHGKEQIRQRMAILRPMVKDMRPRQDLLPGKDLPLPEETDTSLLSKEQFWRTLIVSFVTGLAVGVFGLWQIQEMRRRRQARA